MSSITAVLFMLVIVAMLVAACGAPAPQPTGDCVTATTTACINAEVAARLFGCGLECQAMCKDAAERSCERLGY